MPDPTLTRERVQALLALAFVSSPTDGATGYPVLGRVESHELDTLCRAWLALHPDTLHQLAGDGFAACGVDRDVVSVEEPKAVTCDACKKAE